MTALREHLQDATQDDVLVQEIPAAYYDDVITFDQLKALLGAEEAANFRALKQRLDGSWSIPWPSRNCRRWSQAPRGR